MDPNIEVKFDAHVLIGAIRLREKLCSRGKKSTEERMLCTRRKKSTEGKMLCAKEGELTERGNPVRQECARAH